MDYKETLAFLYSSLPMYQRIGPAAYKTDLNNTIALCKILGNPQEKFRSVHIAGTNGKGSTAHMTASVLQESGLKTGLYTSPHLIDFRERIRIDGKMIPEDFVVEFVKNHARDFENIKPSFFEMTVGMAFLYFASEGIDIAVIETGLGGRLDSTNVVTPMVSVITNIGMEHTRFLGNSLQEIAAEKAGIIKHNVPLVIGESQEETSPVFRRIASEKKAPIFFADKVWSCNILQQPNKEDTSEVQILKNGDEYIAKLRFPLGGEYQFRNLITLMQTIDCLVPDFPVINKESITSGIEDTKGNTGFAGRWQILGSQPLVIADSAHNKEGLLYTTTQLDGIICPRKHFVLGFVNDKNPLRLLELFPKHGDYYFCKAEIPRSLDPCIIQEAGISLGLHCIAIGNVRECLAAAISRAEKEDLIYIGGSTFVVAEALQVFEDIL